MAADDDLSNAVFPGNRRGDRQPALTAALALAAGIAFDRATDAPAAIAILAGALALLAATWLARTRPRWGTIAVLVAVFGAGAARHHAIWSSRSAKDIALLRIVDDSPISLTGVIDSAIEIIPSSSTPGVPIWKQSARSICVVRCESLLQADGSIPCDGLLRLTVDGHLLHARQGDHIALVGRIHRPAPPRTPGDFDFPAWLRAQGIDRVLNVNHPDAIRRIGDAGGLMHHLGRFRQRLREECRVILATSLSERTQAVGASLLLGTRTGLTDDIREAFINSGTMHLLAISGLNLAILLTGVMVSCRVLNFSTVATTLAVIFIVWAYTLLTDARPPVLRAAVMGTLAVVSVAGARPRSGFNLLAAAAFVLLVRSPCDLFDVGAQLSFLAVAAIIWSTRWINRLPRIGRGLLLDSDRSRSRRDLQSALTGARDGYLVTAAVWLFTLPITMSAFHLVSLVGFLINVILIPLSAPLMACGFATLACGLIWKPLAIIPAFGYDLCLRILLILVEESARLRWSHWMVSGPTPVWLFAFYAVLACAVLLPRITARRWAWRALAAVVAIPLALSLRRNSPDGLRCTFVDVGHGGATLIELPNGRTLLFDAGSFGNENRAQRSIEEALRERRISRLDAILISHADSDHYNAAASLLADLPVASLLFPKAFLDFSQPGVVQLCEAAAALSVPQRIVQQGDQFLIDSETTITVLHPQGAVVDPFDNANSLCLRVDYAGRSILLVGDVERGGLASLLSQASPGQMDVLQAPHHGARSANTMDLARWARPKFVVACAADPDVSSRLKAIYRDAEAIFASADSGSVSITISSDGELDVETSLKM